MTMAMLLIGAVLGYSGTVVAEGGVRTFYNGNKLQRACYDTRSGEPRAAVGHYAACVGYLAGVRDAAAVILQALEARPILCAPFGVTPEQMRQVWLKFAQANPEFLHLSAASLALGVYRETWPCP